MPSPAAPPSPRTTYSLALGRTSKVRQAAWRLFGTVAASSFLLALASEMAAAQRPDPLVRILYRMNRYFQQHEVDGVTLDSRYDLSPSEVIRLSVVCQLLGYAELYRSYPVPLFRPEVVERADYATAHVAEITSHTPFDGMLGYSFLEAYDLIGDPRYLAQGTAIVNELKSMSTGTLELNGGLMAAMALAKYQQLTGDVAARNKAHDILALLPSYQNADGSFPHWCFQSKDIHYTSWMTMELILIQRVMDDPIIDPTLAKMLTFMEGRVDDCGVTHYQEPCPGRPGCTLYYYSLASGCSSDYDTRAYTNELGYTALLFEHFQRPKYAAVMGFLESLEDGGALPDKWGFWPNPSDPTYPWTVADTSVIRMSVTFWSLCSILSGRSAAASRELAWSAGEEDEPLAQPCNYPPGAVALGDDLQRVEVPRPSGSQLRGEDSGSSAPEIVLDPILPNPTRDGCEMRFVVSERATVWLGLYDVSGRLIREIASGPFDAGVHRAHWDGRDRSGNRVGSGLYFVRLRAGRNVGTTRILVTQ